MIYGISRYLHFTPRGRGGLSPGLGTARSALILIFGLIRRVRTHTANPPRSYAYLYMGKERPGKWGDGAKKIT